jgi:TM2 domain-containing membrane protein YozV
MTKKKQTYFITLFLCLFFGLFGLHRFYVKKHITATLMILSLGGAGLWYLFDIITILSGNFKNKSGKKITY